MEEICLLCGDKGFDNAFVYCIRCLNVPIHRYCLDVIPETVDEFVPWVCDFCKDEARKIGCYYCEYKARMGIHISPKRGEMAFVHEDDAEESHDARFSESDEQLRCQSCSSQELQEPRAEDGLIREDEMRDVTLTKESKGKKRKNVDSNPGMPDPPIIACDGSLRSSKKKKTGEESAPNPNIIHNDDGQCPDTEEGTPAVILRAEPLIIPTWRGSFSIRSKENATLDLDGLAAHMSIKACQKVYVAASQFQPVLRLEMLRKINVWPKSFEGSGPSGDDIALYFFSSDTSSEVFESLNQKMIQQDLALKASLCDAELLIFTSLELPLLYWKFQGKHFLWGVFRKKQDNPNASSVNPEDNPVQKKDHPTRTPTRHSKNKKKRWK